MDFFELMEEVESTCLLENQGSTTLKDIHLMVVYLIFFQLFFFFEREAGKYMDQGCGFEFIRLEEDGPSQEASPHIYAIKVNKCVL